MKPGLVVPLLVLALGAPSARAQEAPGRGPPSVELPDELDRVLRDYESAWSARDPAALAALFTAHGFVMARGRPPVRGRSAIREHYRDSGGPLHLRAFAYAMEGSTAYILGGYAGREGEPDDGKFTLTLRRDADGRWLIVSDMDNGNRQNP